jgi:hypothetical protein
MHFRFNRFYFSNYRSLFFVALLSVAITATQMSNEKLDCYIKHLKEKQLLDKDYPISNTRSSLNCEVFVKKVSDLIYESVLSKYRQKGYSDASCTINDLKSKNWSDISLVTVVYKVDVTLTVEERDQKMSESRTKSLKEVLISQQKCGLTNDVFKKKFDKEFQMFMDYSPEPETAFCLRKFDVENGLIDLKKNNINVNPKNISDKNCHEIIDEKYQLFKNAIEVRLMSKLSNNAILTDEQKKCYVKKYSDFRLFSQNIKVQVLARLHITNEQKEDLKKEYIKLIHEVQVSDCF